MEWLIFQAYFSESLCDAVPYCCANHQSETTDGGNIWSCLSENLLLSDFLLWKPFQNKICIIAALKCDRLSLSPDSSFFELGLFLFRT